MRVAPALAAVGAGFGLLCALACTGVGGAGSTCQSTPDCVDGLECLYALGSGCDAQGQCQIETHDCSGATAGLVVCGCGAPLDTSCISSSLSLEQRTATGPACMSDGGQDASRDASTD
jgi:hypothetical protein